MNLTTQHAKTHYCRYWEHTTGAVGYIHTLGLLGTDMCVCYLTQVYAETDFEPTGFVLAEELVELVAVRVSQLHFCDVSSTNWYLHLTKHKLLAAT